MVLGLNWFTRSFPSLSARRAWIEMKVLIFGRASKPPSLSARRAWIEISTTGRGRLACGVALRKESVDRNFLVYGS